MRRIDKEVRRRRLMTTRKRKAEWEPGDETNSESDADASTTSDTSRAQPPATLVKPGGPSSLKEDILRDLGEQITGPPRAPMDGEVRKLLHDLESNLSSAEIVQRHLVRRSEDDMRKVLKTLVQIRRVCDTAKVSLNKLHNAIGASVCEEVKEVGRQLELIVTKAYRIANGTECQRGPLLANPSPMVAGAKEAFQEIKDVAKAGAGKAWTKLLARLLCASDWASKEVERCHKIQLPEATEGALLWTWYVGQLQAKYFSRKDFSLFTAEELRDKKYPVLVSVQRVIKAAQEACEGLEDLSQQRRTEKALGKVPGVQLVQQQSTMPPPPAPLSNPTGVLNQGWGGGTQAASSLITGGLPMWPNMWHGYTAGIPPPHQTVVHMGAVNPGLAIGGLTAGAQGAPVAPVAAPAMPMLTPTAAGQQAERRTRPRRESDWNPLSAALQRVKPGFQASDEQLMNRTKELRLCFAFAAAGFNLNGCQRMAKGQICSYKHAAPDGSGDLVSLYVDAVSGEARPTNVRGGQPDAKKPIGPPHGENGGITGRLEGASVAAPTAGKERTGRRHDISQNGGAEEPVVSWTLEGNGGDGKLEYCVDLEDDPMSLGIQPMTSRVKNQGAPYWPRTKPLEGRELQLATGLLREGWRRLQNLESSAAIDDTHEDQFESQLRDMCPDPNQFQGCRLQRFSSLWEEYFRMAGDGQIRAPARTILQRIRDGIRLDFVGVFAPGQEHAPSWEKKLRIVRAMVQQVHPGSNVDSFFRGTEPSVEGSVAPL